MALENVKQQYERYVPRNNDFYRLYYHYFLIGLMVTIVLMTGVVCFVLYQMNERPLPVFSAIQPDDDKMFLPPYEEPNLLPDTILRWASKGATSAYTFDFVNYKNQILAARSYFTEAGWQDYLRSVEKLINTIVENQLFVNAIVSGTPVIANEGPLPGKGYTWRVQIPFLVTYQSANAVSQRKYMVVLTIVRVPTATNPQGIGIDQFVMV